MLILNFTHPLNDEQVKQIEQFTGQKVEEIRQIPVHFDNNVPYEEQIEDLIKECNLTPTEWQSKPILIVPPSFNFIAVTLLAALHGLMGYFPPIVRLRPIENQLPVKYEVAEIINLQKIRDKFRKYRTEV